ncbi:hypothetical protein EDD85DRAFT_862000, partial [Armillaria nabsnona]
MGRRIDSGAPTLLFWVYIGSSMIYRILITKACMFAKNGVSRAAERRLEGMIHQGVATTMVYFSLFYIYLQSRTLHRDYEHMRDRAGTRS